MKDKRKHIYISEKKLIERLELVKHLEKLTYDEVLEKYLSLPEPEDFIHKEYDKIEKLIVLAYKKENKSFNEQRLKYLMELLWILIISSATDLYDIEKLISDIESDLKHKTYKKHLNKLTYDEALDKRTYNEVLEKR